MNRGVSVYRPGYGDRLIDPDLCRAAVYTFFGDRQCRLRGKVMCRVTRPVTGASTVELLCHQHAGGPNVQEVADATTG